MNTTAFYMVVMDDGKTVGFLPSTKIKHNLTDKYYMDGVIMDNYFDPEFYDTSWMYLTPTSYLRTVEELPSRPLSEFYHEDEVDFDLSWPARLGECYLIEEINTMFVFIGGAFVEYPYDCSEWSNRFWDESLCVDDLSKNDIARRKNFEHTGVMNHDKRDRNDWSQSSHSIH